MSRKFAAISVALAAALLAACGGGGNAAGSGPTYTLPSIDNLSITATVPRGTTAEPLAKTGTVGEERPDEGLGTVKDPFWSATLGGYTQQQFSQALGFPPGTKITIKNLSPSFSHTFNVVAKITGPPATFPQNPTLSTQPHGKTIKLGYASGIIKPGGSVTVLAKTAGIYLFGCAFHYHFGMQDVIVIAKGATPGPQATAPVK
jgi:plastocyanin